MKLKLITAAIISINVLVLFQEIPNNVIILTIASIFLSLIVYGKKIRNALKVLLLIAAMVILRLQFKNLLVTECGVSFALLLSSLKFWELNEERDHFNMFLILALCECCVFLLNPTFLIFAFGMATMLFYFYYILKIRNYDVSLLNTKRLLMLVTPSLVVSLLLFYTFPRFTSGFINSSDMQYIISGGSSKLDFSQLGPLSTSSEVAFKVRGLEDSGLPFKIIYWRSTVLWTLDKDQWTSSNSNLRQENPVVENAKFKYNVEVTQNYKEYLPTLDGSSSIMNSSLNFNSYSDGTNKLKTISRGALNYSVIGKYGDRQPTMNSMMQVKGLKIKSIRSNAIWKKYFANAKNSPNDEERLKELIQIFRSRNFQYNISPPLYPTLEEFLLTGKDGYCSHFSAAFTYLARLYNLPARIVSGYLGGEVNPYDNSLIVRELDAHAWSEVYIKNKGWVKIDPTALVAPARVTMSAQEFNNSLNPYITILNFQISRELFTLSFINNASMWLDALNSKFNTNIFNFDRDKQLAILKTFTPKNFSVGWIFAISLCVSLAFFWIIFFYYGKKKMSPDEKRYLRFIKKMESHGLTKHDHETISHFRLRALGVLPNEANYINREVSHYIDSFYK